MSNMCDQHAISISYTAQAAALPSFNGGSSIVTSTNFRSACGFARIGYRPLRRGQTRTNASMVTSLVRHGVKKHLDCGKLSVEWVELREMLMDWKYGVRRCFVKSRKGNGPPNVSDDGPGVMIRDRTLAFGPKWHTFTVESRPGAHHTTLRGRSTLSGDFAASGPADHPN